MKRIIIPMMAAVLVLSSCSDKTEDAQQKEIAKLNEADMPKTVQIDPSGAVRTEEKLASLLQAVKADKVVKNVRLVGTLKLGSNPKWDPHKLSIGTTSIFIYFSHDLDRIKYDGQTVLVLGDISFSQGDERQVGPYMVENVQYIEVMEKP